MKEEVPIIIIGGNFSGIAFGLAAKKAGIQYMICEKEISRDISHNGVLIWKNGSDALKAYNVDMSKFPVINQYNLFNKNGNIIEDFKLINPIYATTRTELKNEMLLSLGDNNVSYNKHFFQLKDETPRGYRTIFHDKTEYVANLLIAADGLNSHIRERIKKDGRPEYGNYTIWRGTSEGNFPNLPKDILSDYLDNKKRVIIYYIGNNKWAWLVASFESYKYQHQTENRKKKLLGYFKEWDPIISEVINASADNLISKNNTYIRDSSTVWGNKNLLYVGDALNLLHPLMGQGINITLELSTAFNQLLEEKTPLSQITSKLQETKLKRVETITQLSTRYSEFPIEAGLFPSLFKKTAMVNRIKKIIAEV